MNQLVRVLIPNDFFDQIETDELADFLIRKGFTEAFRVENVRSFRVGSNRITIVDRKRACDSYHILIRLNLELYSDIAKCDFIKLIQEFGWGKCKSCRHKSDNPSEKTFCYKLFYDFDCEGHVPDTFGCIYYEFKKRST